MMAEVLALGISRYPPLSGPDNRMSGILQRMLRNPDLLPALRTPGGWSAPTRAEWSTDEGTEAAGRHRADPVAWMRRVHAELGRFTPYFALIRGDDQYENFQEDIVAGDYAPWRAYGGQAAEDCGQQEILNWMCLAGALQALERKPRETGFVDTWIFNSSKVFLLA
jgi:hypothetical protein